MALKSAGNYGSLAVVKWIFEVIKPEVKSHGLQVITDDENIQGRTHSFAADRSRLPGFRIYSYINSQQPK